MGPSMGLYHSKEIYFRECSRDFQGRLCIICIYGAPKGPTFSHSAAVEAFLEFSIVCCHVEFVGIILYCNYFLSFLAFP